MIDVNDATAIAQAAQTGVTGCALLSAEDTTDAAWHTVILSTGDLVRVDTVDGSRPNAAIAALLAADWSDTAKATRAKQRAVQSAVAGLLLSNDPATRALLKILEVQQTRANDLAELLAKVLSWAKVQPGFPLWVGREAEYANALAATPRLTESAIQAKVVQMMLAADAPPNPQPLAPGGG